MQRMCIKVHKSVQFSAHFVHTHNNIEEYQMTTKLDTQDWIDDYSR